MNEIIDLKKYGYTDFYRKQLESLDFDKKELIPARVIEVHREKYKIISKYGEKMADLKGSLFYNDSFENEYPTVGDFVLVKYNEMGNDVIYDVLKRKSQFLRLDTWNLKKQIVASNFDYVFIVVSLNNDFNVKRIERYLSCAWQSGAVPVIVLTKLDLCDDYSDYLNKLNDIAFGVDIFPVSSVSGEGIEDLKKFIGREKTIVFTGSSGVGKSSLINVLAGRQVMNVNSIREDDSKGRHTTTHRQMIFIENDNMIIDTPGMREMGIWDAADGIEETFKDIEELSRKCKFRDCRHKTEPGCAVKKAIEQGILSKERFKNYVKLQKEAEFTRQKEMEKTKINKFNQNKKRLKIKR